MVTGVDSMLVSTVMWGAFFGLMTLAVAWDLHQRRIPNSLLLALAVGGLGANVWLQSPGPALLFSVGGLAAGFVLWLPPYALRLVGAADLKLAAAIGVWLGPLGCMRASILAALVGGVLALFTLIAHYGWLATFVRLRTITLGYGDPSPGSSARAPTLPYALALLLGVVLQLLSLDSTWGLI